MSLIDTLLQRIMAQGPLSIADYMTEALFHPSLGYYTTKEVFGTQGDFVTAPEISQMFGEVIGLCLAQNWIDQGSPKPFVLAELGPGRGTLMADILRACARVPGFRENARIFLVEVSPKLRKEQGALLDGYDITFVDDVQELPQLPLWLIANEFFDALPIRQFLREGNLWRERCVGSADGALAFGLAPPALQPLLDHRLDDTKDGDLVELCTSVGPIISQIAQRIHDHSGTALIIDYGDWRSLGDTLQAVRQHKFVDPLSAPGTADITAHVDFEQIAAAAGPVRFAKLTTQGVFLERLGITARAQSLAKNLHGDALEKQIAAHRRLTHPAEMGNLFKVLGLFPKTAPAPPGLEL